MPRGKKTQATKRKRASRKAAKAKPKAAALPTCEVQGCTSPALEVHDGPRGPVHLCGRCGGIARQSLADAQARAEVLDIAATPFQKSMARQALRRQERVHAAIR